jgi:hypothetical protein
MVYPDTISVYHKIRPIKLSSASSPPTSFILDAVVLSHRHRRIAAKLEEDIVVYDYLAGKKAALPGFVAEAFRQTEQLQEEQMNISRERIAQLLDMVRDLEKETWDREGAVEDFGSSTKK